MILFFLFALITLPPQKGSPAFVVPTPSMSHTNAILTWDNVEGAEGYEIWQCRNKWGCSPFNPFDSANWGVIAVTTTNQFVVPQTNIVYATFVDEYGNFIGVFPWTTAGDFKVKSFNRLGCQIN